MQLLNNQIKIYLKSLFDTSFKVFVNGKFCNICFLNTQQLYHIVECLGIPTPRNKNKKRPKKVTI